MSTLLGLIRDKRAVRVQKQLRYIYASVQFI